MLVERVITTEQRAELQAFFAGEFDDIAPNAIPAIENDALFDPYMYAIRPEPDCSIAAGLITCRYLPIVGAVQANMPGAANVAERHSWIDLIATSPEAQSLGYASALMTAAELDLTQAGIRAWIGCVDSDGDEQALRTFYADRGFTVTENGESIPPLLGFPNWAAGHEDVRFYFYKRPAAEPPH